MNHVSPVCEVKCTFQLRGTSYSAKSGGQTHGRTPLATIIGIHQNFGQGQKKNVMANLYYILLECVGKVFFYYR